MSRHRAPSTHPLKIRNAAHLYPIDNLSDVKIDVKCGPASSQVHVKIRVTGGSGSQLNGQRDRKNAGEMAAWGEVWWEVGPGRRRAPCALFRGPPTPGRGLSDAQESEGVAPVRPQSVSKPGHGGQEASLESRRPARGSLPSRTHRTERAVYVRHEVAQAAVGTHRTRSGATTWPT